MNKMRDEKKMAEIDFKCPECSKSVKSDDSLCGEFMACPSCSAEITIPIPGLTQGMKIGDFELMEKLGSGSMGEVWLAYQKTMDRKVALKILAPKYGSDSNFIDRFMSEVKHSAKLSHPNIVTAFYAGTDKGHYYLAISYVIGKTVEDLQMEKGQFKEKDALGIIMSITNALEYAWNDFKILHRDIKPANIMVNKRGEAMLLDLGIAKSVEEESNLTMAGTVVGTPYYISPEQAMALGDIDFRSDIYSLGTTLYHMVTGSVPYNATTAMAIIMKHINSDFPMPDLLKTDLSPGCSRLIEIMMSKEREQRQHSWGELRADIEQVLAGNMPGSANSSDETVIFSKSAAKKGQIEQKSVKTSEESDRSNKILKVAISVAIILIIGVIAVIAYPYFKSSENTDAGMVGPMMPTFEENNDSSASTYNAEPDKTVSSDDEVEGIVVDDPVVTGYNTFCEELLGQTSLQRKAFLRSYLNKKVTWSGKMVDVKGRSGKYEIQAYNKLRASYKGFNLILISYTKDGSVPALKIGENIKFTGNIYNYRIKSTSVVIVYVKNVIINK